MSHGPMIYAPTRVTDQRSLDQMVGRLCLEFGGRFTAKQVRRAAQRCLDDLAGSPPGAMPELGERLTRQRLLDAEPMLA